LLYAGDPQFYASRVCDFASDPKENITERLAAFKILGNLDTPLANKIVEKAVADLKAYNYLPLAHEFESMSSTLENDAVFEKVRDVAEKALGQETFVANEIFASADTFIVENAVTLHGRAAETYPWIGSVILRLAQRGNSNVATRITRHFTRDIALLPPTHQGQMREVLQHLQESGVALGAPTNQVIERALRLVTPQSSLANPDDCPAA